MIDLLDPDGERRVLLAEDDRQRVLLRASDSAEFVVDRLGADGLELRNLRLRPSETTRLNLAASEYRELAPGWGLLAHSATGPRPRTIWLPRGPRRVLGDDPAGRLQIEPVGAAPRRHLSATGVGWELEEVAQDAWWTLPLVVMDDPDRRRHAELERASAGAWPLLLKSEWFRAASPADLWDALIDGAVLDPRPCAWSPRRFRCQQCALAWWSYLELASQAGGSPLWRTLASEVAWTVRVQLEEPGGWHHGFFHQEPETQMRFFVDGVNLLLCEAGGGGRGGASSWLAAADRAMRNAVARFSDELPDGSLWLLHDSLETEAERPPEAAPRLGQASGNVLCLNTHLQALAALARLQRGIESPWAASAYERGMAALQRMLELDSAPGLYGGLDRLLPSVLESRGRDGLPARAARALFLGLLRRPYWWLRRSYPRFVHPNGFIERDMASAMLADNYHVLNVKDLLVLYSLDPRPWLEPSIRAGVGFLRRLDLQLGLARSPMFLEAVEVLRQYGRLFEAGATAEADRAAETVRATTGGASLDDAFWSGAGLERAIGPLSADVPG